MTYLTLGAVVVAGAGVVAGVAVARHGRRFLLAVCVTAAVLVALTAVFDSAMIAADLFRYDPAALVGVRVGRAPVEDLAWPLVAALLLPSVWVLLPPARSRADAH